MTMVSQKPGHKIELTYAYFKKDLYEEEWTPILSTNANQIINS